MKSVKQLFVNTVIMTVTSIIIRSAGVSFQVYLSNKIGAEGIGLYQLIFSVYILAITLSDSGVRLASTRLVAEELGKNRAAGARKALGISFAYALFFGMLATFALYFGAEYFGTRWLGDVRTVRPLRLFALSLPFLAVSSVMSGYFTAVRKIVKSSAAQMVEQFVGIAVTVALFIYITKPGDLEEACVAIVIGSVIGEIASFFLALLLFALDIRRYKDNKESSDGIPMRVFKIAFPVALGAYVASGMRTVQQVLIPIGFKKHGASSGSALATYGTITGMVMPIIMFPAVIYSTVSELIIPELAEAKARGNLVRIKRIIERLISLGIVTSLGIMSVVFFYPDELSAAIYKNTATSNYMRLLVPLIPLMYLDILVDGILKGIGEQTRTMLFNSIESVVSVVLIYFILPVYAAEGYIFVLLFGRLLNFSLSLGHLLRVTDFRVKFMDILITAVCIFAAYNMTALVTRITGATVVLRIVIYIATYTLAILILKRAGKGVDNYGKI